MKIIYSRLVKQNIYFLLAVLLSLFLLVLVVTHYYYLLIVIALMFLAILKKPLYLGLSLGLFVLMGLIYMSTKSDAIDRHIQGYYTVTKKTTFGFVIEEQGSNLFVFSRFHVQPEDEVFVSGQAYVYQGKMTNYFRSLNVQSILSNAFVTRIKVSKNVFNTITNFLITGKKPYDQLVSLLILGQKNYLNYNFYKTTIAMNIAYLFVISGFHIGILYFTITKALFFIKKLNQDIISCFLILTYIIIIKVPTSALRSWIMIYIWIFMRHFKTIKWSKVEIMTISLMIIVIINPHVVFSFSLPLTFIATFVILNIMSLEISKVKKTLMIPFVMFICMLPFNVIFNGQINLTAPFYSLLITPIFTAFYVLLIPLIPFRLVANFLCQQFILLIENIQVMNLHINVDRNWSWVFFIPYFFFLISFIIYEVWYLCLVKKNI